MKTYLGVVGTNGKILRDVTDSNGLPVVVTGSNAADGQTLWTPGMLYNEATSDKPRGNTQGTLLASAARTATIPTAVITNYNARGVVLYLNITVVPAAPGAGGLILRIIAQDTVVGGGNQINTSAAAIITTGMKTHIVYPGATTLGAEVTQITSSVIPRNWYVWVQHGDAQAYTYSLNYALIL